MKPTDKAAFAAILVRTWKFYGKAPDADDAAAWFGLLEGFAVEAIGAAFQQHLIDTKAGQYLPKPADIIRHLAAAQPDDGHPGPEEAWGILVRLIQDEAETGVLTEEMRKGWEACGPVMDLGDEVGARRCFLEVYSKRLSEARQRAATPRWSVTLGTDPTLRRTRLQEAIEAGRMSAAHASSLLSGPTTSSLSQVAGLLEGPDATPSEIEVAKNLRGLVEALKAGRGYLEHKNDERNRRDEEEAEKKRRIQELLDRQQEKRKAS